MRQVKPEQVTGDIDVGAIAEVVLQRFDALKHSLAVRVVLTHGLAVRGWIVVGGLGPLAVSYTHLP